MGYLGLLDLVGFRGTVANQYMVLSVHISSLILILVGMAISMLVSLLIRQSLMGLLMLMSFGVVFISFIDEFELIANLIVVS